MLELKINRVNDKTKATSLTRWEHLLFALNGWGRNLPQLCFTCCGASAQ